MSTTETHTNEFGKGFISVFAICVFAGAIFMIVVPDNTHSANRLFAEGSKLLMPISNTYNNRGRSPPASSRGSGLNVILALDEAFQHAAAELRKASRPPPNRTGSRTILRK